MTQFAGYIFRQTLWPTLFFLVLLTGVVWLSQGLKMLDVILNRGQTAGTFLELTVYVLPSLLTLVLPISLFCAVLYTLNRLYTDSEIVVMWSAGLGRWSIAAPIVVLALATTLVGYFLSLYLMPVGYRAMKDKIYEIRADIATGLFQEGSFTYPISGVTVYVREITPSGELKGIFVNDTRKGSGGTHMAESGRLVRTPRGPMLIMKNGTSVRPMIEQGAGPLFVQFEEYQYLPEEFAQVQSAGTREYTERFLPELLAPDPKIPWELRNRGRLISEGHMRLSTPLFNLALPMIAIVSLLCGSFSRRGFAGRIVIAVVIALLARISAVAAHSLVQANLSLTLLHYLIPLGTIGVCALLLSGFDPRTALARFQPRPAAAP
jgi:lipopolysaccharide export system permease protein